MGDNNPDIDSNWNLLLERIDRDGEYHHLSKVDLLEILQEEWQMESNVTFIGRDINSTGRILAFFNGSDAIVGYEDFEKNNEIWTSYHPVARSRPDWDEYVAVWSPYEFPRCMIIPKSHAWRILIHYLATLQYTDMFLLDENFYPYLSAPPLQDKLDQPEV